MSELPHFALNTDRATTVVLLHGGNSSPNEFLAATPHLSDYHLLLPALPSHELTRYTDGGSTPRESDREEESSEFVIEAPGVNTASTDNNDSRDISIVRVPGPFSLPEAAKQVAALIRRRAKGGTAHLVGCSLGGILALHLAAHDPEVVGSCSVVASGLNKVGSFPAWKLQLVPYVFAVGAVPAALLPQSLYAKYIQMTLDAPAPLDTRQMQAREASAPMLRRSHEIVTSLRRDEKYGPVQARCLVVAATLSGWMKFPDSVDAARAVFADITSGTGGGRGSMVAQVPGCSHPWNIQNPELFARTVTAWVEAGDLPDGVQELST